jgi:hypothetical protein
MRHVAGGKALIALWCAGILSALVLLTGTALATDAGTTAELTGGDLSISAALQGGSFAGTLNGRAQTLMANAAGGGTAFSGFQIKDARGTGVGWAVTVAATQFANADRPGKDIALGSLSMPLLAVAKADVGSSAVPGTLNAPGTIDTGGAGVVVAACSAQGQGMGTYDFTAADDAPWQLTLSADEYAGTYSSTITTTLSTLAL